MDVSAKLRYLRMSPRKVRLVLDLIRGRSVSDAQSQLEHLSRWAAKPVLKLLNSAVANAEHNFKLKPDGLYVKHVTADMGPTLKRFHPKAFGRADVIRKRTTHITLILSERAGAVSPPKPPKRSAAPLPIVPEEKIHHEAKTEQAGTKTKKPAKRVLTRAKELGSKIIHRRGEE